MSELPVLITAVTARAAQQLEEAARSRREVWVRLEREPANGGPHVLEVYTADRQAPIRLLAEPLGAQNEYGTALRLHPWQNAESAPQQPAARKSLGGGRFEILAPIGGGSIGAVFRARHTGLNRIVAVKVLHEAFQRDAEFCGRFYAEALAMSRLNHVNLISVHDFGQEPDGLLYIAMPLVEGHSLREIQQRERRFEVPRIVAWMLQVCAGLGHAHAKGFIHRDVKPDNLMIVTTEDDDGQSVETIKVLDFGFAVPPSVSGEVAQRLAGTPVYMSPEQCRGEELDARSDIYACGIMMYELVTGSVPFLASDGATLRQMHVSAPVPRVATLRPDIDPRYERVVQRALSKDREDRQASMKDLRAELKNLLLPESTPSLAASASGTSGARSVVATPPPSSPGTSSPTNADDDDDWLERGSGYSVTAAAPVNTLAEKLARDASSWLGELSRERDPRIFARRVEELDGAVRKLAERGDARTLSRVSAVVGGLAEVARDDAGRTALAAVGRLFANPDVLAPIATILLTHENAQDPQRVAAASLVSHARISGAVALYGVRARLAEDARLSPRAVQVARIAFVTTMKSLGTSARPVLRAALERLYEEPRAGQDRGAVDLVEDVLLSMPKGDDEAVGELAASFSAAKIPSVARAAARALPRVWGERARPVLLSLIPHEADEVCIAAIVGLHELDAIDLDAVARIAAQINAGRARSQPLAAAFATALRSATPSAQAEALAALSRLPR